MLQSSRWHPIWQHFLARGSSSSANKVVRDQRRWRKRCQQRIDPVEHSAVAGKKFPAVLDTAVALELRLEKIADDGQAHERQHQSDPGDHAAENNRSGISSPLRE